MNFNEFFTWSVLTTFAGAMAATALITQFLKEVLGKYFVFSTRLLAYIVAVVVLCSAMAVNGELNLSSFVLALFNGVIIAGATSGTVDAFKEAKRDNR